MEPGVPCTGSVPCSHDLASAGNLVIPILQMGNVAQRVHHLAQAHAARYTAADMVKCRISLSKGEEVALS